MIERCGDGCVRPLGHTGECRATWHDFERCGAWLPVAQTTCQRRKGHRGGWGRDRGGHRSEAGMVAWGRQTA